MALWLVLFCGLFLMSAAVPKGRPTQRNLQTYIITTDNSQRPTVFSSDEEWHSSLASTGSDDDQDNILYNYKSVVDGFAAHLTHEQAKAIMNKTGVVQLIPPRKYVLHTTRSLYFMGLSESRLNSGLLNASSSGKGIIIGVLDSGVNPHSSSFRDDGMAPPPSRWKGRCEGGSGFRCNNKLIGARFFGAADDNNMDSAQDFVGHGTHTASTAAGAPVANASLYGFAEGTARGVAADAWVAVYKICQDGSCSNADILAGIDAAIADGVDVLSMSIGTGPVSYESDVVAIGSFAAMANGIFVSASAGNKGPTEQTLSNVAPWITTVGATTIDRSFPGELIVGSRRFPGLSAFSGPALAKPVPLISGLSAATSQASVPEARECQEDSLDPDKIIGKIVFCEGSATALSKSFNLKSAGAAGVIFSADATVGTESVRFHPLPAITVDSEVGAAVKKIIANIRNPTALILARIPPKKVVAPAVASFSSRGSNPLTQDILKPDLCAPGVNILAAWTNETGPTSRKEDTRRVRFNILSGTSMACPHISGIAALLKAVHPDWSPAAIRSAMMTTATPRANNGKTIISIENNKPSTPFDMGAGNVQPQNALSPGLIYDLEPMDYMGYLCGLNLSTSKIRAITRKGKGCSQVRPIRAEDFNYPSFSAVVTSGRMAVTHRREVTNVGPSHSTYNVRVFNPNERVLSVKVVPRTLVFKKRGQKLAFNVTFTTLRLPLDPFFGSIVWSDSVRTVRSPFAVSTFSAPLSS